MLHHNLLFLKKINCFSRHNIEIRIGCFLCSLIYITKLNFYKWEKVIHQIPASNYCLH